MPNSPRAALPYPLLTDPADVPASVKALTDRLDPIIAMDDQGPLASRPAAGTRGRFYTDPSTGVTYRDDGTQWVAVNPVESAAPSGMVAMFGGPPANIPAGWLYCDGSPVSRTTYAALFSKVGTNWGVGDGSTTFNLPDYRGVMPLGISGTHTLGSKGGAETVALTTAQLPSHSHTGLTGVENQSHVHAVNATAVGVTVAAAATGITQTGGESVLHQHLFTQGWYYAARGTAGDWTVLATPGASVGPPNLNNYMTDTENTSHIHAIGDPTHAHTASSPGHVHTMASESAQHNHNIPAEGGGQTHNNMPPFASIVFMIKV